MLADEELAWRASLAICWPPQRGPVLSDRGERANRNLFWACILLRFRGWGIVLEQSCPVPTCGDQWAAKKGPKTIVAAAFMQAKH